jgi:hypothetical protein
MKPKRKPQTDRDLELMFHCINKQFFDAAINPAIKCRYVSQKELDKRSTHEDGADAMWCPMIGEIWVDEAYKRSQAVSTLLLIHEMAHAALQDSYVGYPGNNQGHGMIYQAELYRLFHAGAFDDIL